MTETGSPSIGSRAPHQGDSDAPSRASGELLRPPGADGDRRLALLIALGLLGLIAAAYWPVGRCGFVNFDDNEYIFGNHHVQAGLTVAGVRWAFTTLTFANYAPLVWLSFMLDAQLLGMGPLGFHLTNVALHAADVLILFALLRSMSTGAAAGTPSRTATWRAALVAALFAVHPLRVESVAWISERKDVLAALFGLLSIAVYVRYTRRGGAKWYVATTALFAASLLTKAMFVTLPALLLLIDCWPLKRPARWKTLVVEKVPLLGLAVAASAATFVAQRLGGAVGTIVRYPLADRIANAAVSYVRYLGKTVYPSDLAAFYPHPLMGWPTSAVIGAAALLVGISAIVYWRRREQPFLAVGWLWYLGAMLPMIGLVQVGGQAMADRYSYLPNIGLLIAIAWAIPQSWFDAARGRLMLGSVVGVALVVLTLITQSQVGYWRDSFALWEHALAVTKDNHVAHTNMAVELASRGDRAGARYHLDEQLKLRPNNSVAHNAYGALLAAEGDHVGAIKHYEAAIATDPSYELARRNLATQYSAVGRDAEAIAQFRRAVELRPEDNVARTLLGIELARKGDVLAAVAQFRAAVEADPQDAEAHLALGRALTETGKLAEGLAHLDEALRLRPQMSEAHYHAGIALARRGDFADAAVRLRAALALDPADTAARAALDQVLAAQSRSANVAE